MEFDDSPTGAVVENNLWTSQLLGHQFLRRDLGKHFSVNVMLDPGHGPPTPRRRRHLHAEFSYMPVAGQRLRTVCTSGTGCNLQVGGSDQWGNIIAGVRLVRQKAGASVHALTTRRW